MCMVEGGVQWEGKGGRAQILQGFVGPDEDFEFHLKCCGKLLNGLRRWHELFYNTLKKTILAVGVGDELEDDSLEVERKRKSMEMEMIHISDSGVWILRGR